MRSATDSGSVADLDRMKRVVAIGTFDGVHLGHAAILRRTVRIARARAWQPAALTFRIPPRQFFNPSPEPHLLSTLEEKKDLCRLIGIGKVTALDFDSALSRMSAADFFIRILMRKMRAGAIVVGYNFGFGKGREGTPDFLSRLGMEQRIGVTVVPEVRLGRTPISSGRIRRMVAAGNVSGAARLLGHPYIISGPVIRGDRRGRTLGFPTANVATDPRKILPPGVFAVRCSIEGASRGGGRKNFEAICNIGVRPTFYRDAQASVEVHLIGFQGNLYGRRLRIEFIKKLRDEKRFSSAEALKKQLETDRKRALQALQ